MHIEINATGHSGSLAISEYQLNMISFVSSADSLISSFKTVKSETYGLSGGVGNLQEAIEDVQSRINIEAQRKESAVEIQTRTNDFIDLAKKVDQQVAILVDKNRDEFYQVNPWLKPPPDPSEKAWYEKAWDWICETGQAIGEGLKAAWKWTKDSLKKAWDGLVEFYQEHKKIIDTVLIVVGAIAAIAAVVATGGLALVPLLGALGASTAVATAISATVAVVAVTSTLAASTLNIIDTWAEIDDPTFNAWQKGLNITSTVSNLFYAAGNIYNSVKGITPQEYIASKQTISDVNQLSGKQIDAISKYTGSDYSNINDSLRGIDTATPDNLETIRTMRTALDNSSLPNDMTLYRGSTTNALGNLKGLPPEELVGKTFIDNGFMSTSTSQMVGNSFSGDMRITINALKGAKGLDISSISRWPGESEVLFNVGQEMLITSAEKINGVLNITVLIH